MPHLLRLKHVNQRNDIDLPFPSEPNVKCLPSTKQKHSVPIVLFLFSENAQQQYVKLAFTNKNRFCHRGQLTPTVVYRKLNKVK